VEASPARTLVELTSTTAVAIGEEWKRNEKKNNNNIK
jgi:hypothetical protein